MDALSLKEKKKYDFLWQEVPSYRTISPGEKSAEYFLRYFDSEIKPGDRIIDFGCGTGRAARFFLEKGLDVTLVDFSSHCLDPEVTLLLSLFPERIRFIESCLWNLSKEVKRASWIYCCDVLEHIPEEKVDEVLQSIASSNFKGGYFSIALKQDLFGMEVLKEPLHVCVHNKDWWTLKISSYWTIASELISPENNIQFHCCVKKKDTT